MMLDPFPALKVDISALLSCEIEPKAAIQSLKNPNCRNFDPSHSSKVRFDLPNALAAQLLVYD